MISYLSIRNFGLFSEVRLDLGEGLTVFTGETGAGKSMVVGAVLACLGQRTSRDLVRSGEDRAVVEMIAGLPPGFALDPADPLYDATKESSEVILQKDILADRSYLRVNGRLATAAMIQELGSRLVDIHGQQEHHSLLRPQNYLAILDSLRRDTLEPHRRAFTDLYRQRQVLNRKIDDLGRGDRERQREIDLLSYQVQEIESAKLRPGEEEELRQEFAVLSSQERLIDLWNRAYEALYEGSRASGRSAKEAVDSAVSELRKVASVDPAVGQALSSVEQVVFEMEAAIDLMREYRKRLAADPLRLRVVSERLDTIQRLKSKYGESIERIIEYGAASKGRLDELQNADLTLAKLRAEHEVLSKEMARLGETLTAIRTDIARAMELDVSRSLQTLGMPGAKFAVKLSRDQEPGPNGFDRVEFLFSANAGEEPMPVNKVASGGELSRLMLAVKSHLEAVDPVPTLIFDEIDSGIGGNAGQAVAERLWQLGRSHQVLCVTHLASIAALADNHYLVSKEERDGRTFASVRRLDSDERAAEVARMLSGGALDISLEHAREMLRASTTYKSSYKSSCKSSCKS
ncbi:MAG: DNA repair protein RecN [Bacillota bacterium]